jgi:hypothetical protein
MEAHRKQAETFSPHKDHNNHQHSKAKKNIESNCNQDGEAGKKKNGDVNL